MNKIANEKKIKDALMIFLMLSYMQIINEKLLYGKNYI